MVTTTDMQWIPGGTGTHGDDHHYPEERPARIVTVEGFWLDRHPVTNAQFSSALGRALHRPAILPAPAFALRLAFGQMADEMLLGGQRVLPARASEAGFQFHYPTVDGSLAHIYP